MKPSTEIKQALEGALPLDHVTPASISSMRFEIYKISCKVLSMPTRKMQADFIDSHPASIQTLIRAETRRIYDLRRE